MKPADRTSFGQCLFDELTLRVRSLKKLAGFEVLTFPLARVALTSFAASTMSEKYTTFLLSCPVAGLKSFWNMFDITKVFPDAIIYGWDYTFAGIKRTKI